MRGLELEQEEPLRLVCVLSLRAHCDEHRAGLAGRSARDKILGAVEENVAISAPGLLCARAASGRGQYEQQGTKNGFGRLLGSEVAFVGRLTFVVFKNKKSWSPGFVESRPP